MNTLSTTRAGQYTSLCDIMSKEYVLKRLESLGLIDKQQITQVLITMYGTSSEEDGFPICELRVRGISPKPEADIVALTVKFDGEVVKEVDIPVMKGESDRYLLKIKEDIVKKLGKDTTECTVLAVDKYGRELVSAVSEIRFGLHREEPVFDCDINIFDSVSVSEDDIRTDIAEVSVTSSTPAIVCMELYESEALLLQNNINIVPGTTSVHRISADSVDLRQGSSSFVVRLKSNGKIIAEKESAVTVNIEKQEEKPAIEVPNVVGDLVLPDYVDTHTVSNEKVDIGSLVLFNKGKDSDIIISVILDGNDLLCTREHLIDNDKEISIDAPFSKLAREDTYTCEIIAHVTDTVGNILIHKISTLRIRSKYDMNLKELRLRSAQFVNPRNKAVMDLVNNSNSLLASSMNGRYMIQGYQNGGKDIMRQMEAVYMMMYHMGMRYVSDTFTFNKTSENYQHVRTPDKVLADKSGNCLEFCILYASFMEAMGLETVIAFPPGHAVVGVVLATDVYSTQSDYDGPDDAPYVMMDVAGKQAFVMFVETTMCPSCSDFTKAVNTACTEIEDNLDSIDLPANHVFIKQMRLKGVDPIINL